LCCVCFYFVALDVSLGFHFLLYVCYVNPAYGCQTEINCVCVDAQNSNQIELKSLVLFLVLEPWVLVNIPAFQYSKRSLRVRSITWPVHRGSPKPHVTIFDPELSIYYTTLIGLRWRLRVVCIGASHVKWFSPATEHSSQNRSQNGCFSEI